MHAYATDTGERRTVFILLGMLSIFLFLGVQEIPQIAHTLQRYQLLTAPSMLGIYGGLFLLFDRYGWRAPVLSAMISTPDLSGRWAGTVKSDHEDGDESSVVVDIQQRWMTINVELRANLSSSYSTMAGFTRLETRNPELTYQYRNDPDPHAPPEMQSHVGTARLTIEDDRESLAGEYYNGRGRKNIGTIHLTRAE